MLTILEPVACFDEPRAVIAEAFLAPFTVWTCDQEDGWQPLDGDDAPPVADISADWLAEQLPPGKRCNVVRDGGDCLVILRIPTEGPAAVAVGRIDADAPVWIERLAATVADNLHQRFEAQQQQLAIDSLAEQVSDTFEELALLRGISSYLECCEIERPLQSVAEALLPRLRSVLRAEAVALVPATPSSMDDDGELTEVVWTGYQSLSDRECRELVEMLTSPSLRTPVVRNGMQKQPEFQHLDAVQACLIVPVMKDEHRIGWLVALNKLDLDEARTFGAGELGRDEFGTIEAGLLSAAALLLATHARNGRLYRERERLVTDVVRSLINTIDAKDSYTCGHSDRVASIARRLAERIGLDRQQCERIFLTGLLHDIGKIGVPDEVLLKPGKLTDEEFALIKRHPVIGYEILKPLRQLSDTLPGVLHHHESMDGRGYPHGLKGDEIPLVARILAVADAYDAMTSCRPYREAMPTEKAESILQSGAGRQWDPRIVDAFFACIDDIRRITKDPAALLTRP